MQKNLEEKSIQFYLPNSQDAYDVNQLVKKSPPLDNNSVYCNLLQCTHFAETSVSAKQDHQLVGFISGYLLPQNPNTLFIWQVVVAASMRGRGLATQMLHELVKRPACQQVQYIETTITASNEASWALFKNFAQKTQAETQTFTAFEKEKDFHGEHESEQLFRIGPISQQLIRGDQNENI